MSAMARNRLLSDPPDEFKFNKFNSISVRLSGHLVHETILDLPHFSLLPQKGDQIALPDGTGRIGEVEYRLFQVNGKGELIISVMVKM